MLININTYDGFSFKGRLLLPEGEGAVSKLVIALDGAGPKTYNDGFPASLLTAVGTAYFSFNKRGVAETDEPPYYTINDDEYKTYYPTNSVEDIHAIVMTVREINRLSKCKILLNGWSEGATIATLFAQKYPELTDALFLCGYTNLSLKETQKWQLSKLEGGDKLLAECDDALERNDREWFRKNMGVTPEWYADSMSLNGNCEVLPSLNLPIFIFHGASDGYCDVQGAYDIRDIFIRLRKKNLAVNVFDNCGHGLETAGLSDGKTSNGINLSSGMKALINTMCNF